MTEIISKTDLKKLIVLGRDQNELSLLAKNSAGMLIPGK
jgi:hypothetical protein